jgi:hypothetical protein
VLRAICGRWRGLEHRPEAVDDGTRTRGWTRSAVRASSLFGWLVADGWCWFVLREEYCWLVAGGWFVLREKYCWLVADKPSEQGALRSWLAAAASSDPPPTSCPRPLTPLS